jgi:hypothetical protein
MEAEDEYKGDLLQTPFDHFAKRYKALCAPTPHNAAQAGPAVLSAAHMSALLTMLALC